MSAVPGRPQTDARDRLTWRVGASTYTGSPFRNAIGIVVSLAADPVLFAVEGRVDRCLLLVDVRGADWSDPAVLGRRINEPDDLPIRAEVARARLGWGARGPEG